MQSLERQQQRFEKKLSPFWDRCEINDGSEINSSEFNPPPQVNEQTQHMVSYTTKEFVWRFIESCV